MNIANAVIGGVHSVMNLNGQCTARRGAQFRDDLSGIQRRSRLHTAHHTASPPPENEGRRHKALGFSHVGPSVMIHPVLFDLNPALMTPAPKPLNVTRIRESTRLAAMLLALTAGVLLVSQLWEQTLDRGTMASAGRGVIFILLALGLMGTRRLSVALTAVLCGTTAMSLLSVGRTITLTDWLEVLILILCIGLLLTSASHRDAAHNGGTE